MALDVSKDEEVSGYLRRAMTTIERARGLTQQLLTFAKGGAPVMKTDFLFPFIRDTVNFVLSGSAVSCRFIVPDDLWPSCFDRNQIGQVIDNIVINAGQAMPDGGRIEIAARNTTMGAKQHPALAAGNYVKISIKDHGSGIPKEILHHIFDPKRSVQSENCTRKRPSLLQVAMLMIR